MYYMTGHVKPTTCDADGVDGWPLHKLTLRNPTKPNSVHKASFATFLSDFPKSLFEFPRTTPGTGVDLQYNYYCVSVGG